MIILRSARVLLPFYLVTMPVMTAWVPLSMSESVVSTIFWTVGGLIAGILSVWWFDMANAIWYDDDGIHAKSLFRHKSVLWSDIARMRCEIRLRAGGEVPDFCAVVYKRSATASLVGERPTKMSVRGVRQKTALSAADRIDELGRTHGFLTERTWVSLRPWSQRPPTGGAANRTTPESRAKP